MPETLSLQTFKQMTIRNFLSTTANTHDTAITVRQVPQHPDPEVREDDSINLATFGVSFVLSLAGCYLAVCGVVGFLFIGETVVEPAVARAYYSIVRGE